MEWRYFRGKIVKSRLLKKVTTEIAHAKFG